MSDEPTITLVHKDARGELYSISIPGNREIMLLHSKAGTLRGGHSHSVPEQVMVVSGKFRYHKLGNRGGGGFISKKEPDPRTEYAHVMAAGDCSPNAAGRIHYGEFLEDSWILEVKLAEKGAWTQTDYEPWRAKVRANANG